MKHTVRSHHWNAGRLEVRIEVFESYELAIEFLSYLSFHSAKVYNDQGMLVSEHSLHVSSVTYA